MYGLEDVYRDIVRGRYPAWDGVTEVIAAPRGARAAVLAFTGHNIVAAGVAPHWVHAQCPAGDLVGAIRGGFLAALGRRINGEQGPLDLVLIAHALEGPVPIELCRRDDEPPHPRLRRALRVREEVQAYFTPAGEAMISVGRGLAGRWEAGFEVEPEHRGQGLGRALVAAARHLVPVGSALFMQVAAGNVASLRAVMAGGFVPIGAEILFDPGENRPVHTCQD